MSVALPCRVASEPPVPWASAMSLFFTWAWGCAAQLADRLHNLRQTTAVGRMIVAEATAVRVERQPADAGDQVAVGDELAALPLVVEKPRSSSVVSPVIVKLS